MDSGKYGNRRARAFAGDAGDRDRRGHLGRSQDLQGWDFDDGEAADNERAGTLGQGIDVEGDAERPSG